MCRKTSAQHTDKKENKNFLIYVEVTLDGKKDRV
jgi:hypothetical protein